MYVNGGRRDMSLQRAISMCCLAVRWFKESVFMELYVFWKVARSYLGCLFSWGAMLVAISGMECEESNKMLAEGKERKRKRK